MFDTVATTSLLFHLQLDKKLPYDASLNTEMAEAHAVNKLVQFHPIPTDYQLLTVIG